VWLNADMLSPFDYWQYWRNVDDSDVGTMLKRMTDVPMDEIGRLAALKGSEINLAKIVLATEATAMLHGRDAAEQAANTAAAQFGGGGADDGLPEFVMSGEVPASIAALFVATGLVDSNGEAKRQAKGGGLRINDIAINDVGAGVPDALREAGGLKLSLGKKRHVLVKLV
jgi:tyrosyl-tRNA synthetase